MESSKENNREGGRKKDAILTSPFVPLPFLALLFLFRVFLSLRPVMVEETRTAQRHPCLNRKKFDNKDERSKCVFAFVSYVPSYATKCRIGNFVPSYKGIFLTREDDKKPIKEERACIKSSYA